MHGRWIDMSWQSRTVSAWLPDGLADRPGTFSDATVRSAERAVAALQLVDRRIPTNWEPLARLLLRTEGIASSSIEGVRAPIAHVAAAELGATETAADWVADNLASVEASLSSTGDLEIDDLHRWHELLMRHSQLPDDMIGRFRPAPGWIGGMSPRDAAFVPPPPDHIDDLVGDLVRWINDDQLDAVTTAALAHAQFETIHPYGDGNGRLGRLLIGWILRRRGVIERLPPPISVLIARDPGGYLAGLHLFREIGSDDWVRWFANVATNAATASDEMVTAAQALLDEWVAATNHLRADSAARRLVPLLPGSPVVSSRTTATLLDTSERSARTALHELTALEILEPIDTPRHPGAGRPVRLYAATKLLEITAAWTR